MRVVVGVWAGWEMGWFGIRIRVFVLSVVLLMVVG